MERILIVEDEQTTREFVVINLKRAGYKVAKAKNRDRALEPYGRENGMFDVTILDIMMPGQHDGLAVCRELYQENGPTDIILLTARTQEMDKASDLMTGADDYVTKPFSPSELVTRADAVYRRVALAEARTDDNFREEVCSGIFLLNLCNRALTKEGAPIKLMQVEFQVTEHFFSNPDKALGQSDILEHTWGDAYYGEEKIVDVDIYRLWMEIEDEPFNPKHIVIV